MIKLQMNYLKNTTPKPINQNNMVQQTAVEWIYIEFQKRFPKETTEMYNNNQLGYEDLILQAKEMEKRQHSETWHDSRENTCIPFDDYYTETYGNNTKID